MPPIIEQPPFEFSPSPDPVSSECKPTSSSANEREKTTIKSYNWNELNMQIMCLSSICLCVFVSCAKCVKNMAKSSQQKKFINYVPVDWIAMASIPFDLILYSLSIHYVHFCIFNRIQINHFHCRRIILYQFELLFFFTHSVIVCMQFAFNCINCVIYFLLCECVDSWFWSVWVNEKKTDWFQKDYAKKKSCLEKSFFTKIRNFK